MELNNNNSMLWVDKYRPNKLNEIIGNRRQIDEIIRWLKNFDSNKKEQVKTTKKTKKINIKIEDTEHTETNDQNEILDEIVLRTNKKDNNSHSCMIVLGDHGVGKTCTVLAILEELKYNIKLFHLSKLGAFKDINETVDKIMRGNNIFDQLLENNIVKTSVVIDEIESVNSPIEKSFITTLLKNNEENWECPIIFITSGKHSKIISTLKSNAKTIYLNQPSEDNLMKLFVKTCEAENMRFTDVDVAYKIISHCQYDYRRLLFILQDLKTSYPNISISNNEVEEYCQLSKQKDKYIDIYKATTNMMTNYTNIDECIRLYESEKVIIPLMIHQNYIKCINLYCSSNKTANKKKNIDLIKDISMSISRGDLIENYIYNDQNWDMQEVHGFFTCVKPSFMLTKEHMSGSYENIRQSLEFPYDFNRTSTKRINKKNIVNSNVCLKNFEIDDFIMVNRLLRSLIQNDKPEICAELLSGYDAKIETIESILKIDKIYDTKSVIPSQTKKKISNLLSKDNNKPIVKKNIWSKNK